jgi:hypothetical protein
MVLAVLAARAQHPARCLRVVAVVAGLMAARREVGTLAARVRMVAATAATVAFRAKLVMREQISMPRMALAVAVAAGLIRAVRALAQMVVTAACTAAAAAVLGTQPQLLALPELALKV